MDIRIGKSIALLQKKADHFINESLLPYSINRSQMEVLLLLRRNNGCSQAELNEHLLFNKGSVTKLLCSLETSGYIKRCCCTNDKRKNEVFLTDKAEAVFPAIMDTITAWESKITNCLTKSEQQTFKKLIEKINDNILSERRT